MYMALTTPIQRTNKPRKTSQILKTGSNLAHIIFIPNLPGWESLHLQLDLHLFKSDIMDASATWVSGHAFALIVT